MTPKGSRKGKRKARGKMPTSVENRRLSLDRDSGTMGLITEHIRGLIRIYNVCGINDERAWDLLYNIIFLDPVTTSHISQFQLMWPHVVLATGPVLNPAGFIGLRGNGHTPSKIVDFLSELSL
jgi:hypothetical protein